MAGCIFRKEQYRLRVKRRLDPIFFYKLTKLPTSPIWSHHKHTGNEVFESTETSVGDVLNRISEKLEYKPKG